jgi:hypothetical protein
MRLLRKRLGSLQRGPQTALWSSTDVGQLRALFTQVLGKFLFRCCGRDVFSKKLSDSSLPVIRKRLDRLRARHREIRESSRGSIEPD